MDELTTKCVTAYNELKHLKLVGERVGIPWQTVYLRLKKAEVSVCGDKARYGSVSDRLASKAEAFFKKAVPFAIDNNESEFQSSVDFYVGKYSIDVKAAKLKLYEHTRDHPRWAYSINKQKDKADFFVCYAFDVEGGDVIHVFLIPREIATVSSSISIPQSLKSKWADYMINKKDLNDFFSSMIEID